MRLQQGSNYRLGSYEVGVMNVLPDRDGPVRLVAHLSVFNPATSSDEHVRVHAGDELALGAERYRVMRVVSEEDSDARPWLEIEPAEPGRPRRRLFSGPGRHRRE